MKGHCMMFNKMLSTMDEPLNHKLIKAFHLNVFEKPIDKHKTKDYDILHQ
jgi:hypothetical protein